MFQRTAQSRYLRLLASRGACPIIAQVAVMEVIGDIVGYIRHETACQVPWHLWAGSRRRGCPQRVPRQKPSDVHLIRGGSLHVVVAVAGVEVPLGAKVVVKAKDAD